MCVVCNVTSVVCDVAIVRIDLTLQVRVSVRTSGSFVNDCLGIVSNVTSVVSNVASVGSNVTSVGSNVTSVGGNVTSIGSNVASVGSYVSSNQCVGVSISFQSSVQSHVRCNHVVVSTDVIGAVVAWVSWNVVNRTNS